MRVVAKKLRDLIIQFAMKVKWDLDGAGSVFYGTICHTDLIVPPTVDRDR